MRLILLLAAITLSTVGFGQLGASLGVGYSFKEKEPVGAVHVSYNLPLCLYTEVGMFVSSETTIMNARIGGQVHFGENDRIGARLSVGVGHHIRSLDKMYGMTTDVIYGGEFTYGKNVQGYTSFMQYRDISIISGGLRLTMKKGKKKEKQTGYRI